MLALGRPPILAKRAFYFENREWESRTRMVSPRTSVRFEQSWAAWTEHRVELPPPEVVRRFLEERASGRDSRRGLRF